MIFIGDIACPYERANDFVGCIQHIDFFNNEIVVLNLEANILKKDYKKRPITLYNSPEVINAFSGAKKIIVSLANNHMYDYPQAIMPTKKYLESLGCGVFGLANNDGKTDPYEFEGGEEKYAFFGHCWRLYTHTNTNDENDVRISDAYYDDFVEMVAEYARLNKDRKIYCFMHWNYD